MQALVENIYAVTVCILNTLPIFVVGKPGTSKTLTLSIIGSNLQGPQSPNKFWRRFPGIHIFPYQCSQMSTALGILQQFNMAVRYQTHAGGEKSVLLLDEVGLAEQSPDLPLKVLHGMLTDPPIAVVGLSNWTLDAAKMNRAICLERNEPTVDDLRLTAVESAVSQHEEVLAPWLSPLAEAYRLVSRTPSGQAIVGMRDFYALLKQLRGLCSAENGLTQEVLIDAVCRNFSATERLHETSVKSFLEKVFNCQLKRDSTPPLQEVLRASLTDPASRHLMVTSSNGFSLAGLFGSGILCEADTTVLVGSEFRDDKTELQLVLEVNAVKRAMARGNTVVLLNHDSVYEALYDVLNQRYITRTLADGTKKLMLRLAIGARSQLCEVRDGFQMVVLVQQEKLPTLDLPLLNRFEKQAMRPLHLLDPSQLKISAQIDQWVHNVAAEVGCSASGTFCSWTQDSAAALAWSLVTAGTPLDQMIQIAEDQLLQVAFPQALLASSQLQQCCNRTGSVDTWFDQRNDIGAVLWHCLESAKRLVVVMTHSQLDQLNRSKENAAATVYQILRLDELRSCSDLQHALQAYAASQFVNSRALVLQCDPQLCSEAMMIHVRHICAQQAPTQGSVVLVYHLPPRIRHRRATYEPPLDFQLPWSYMFCDDCRPSSDSDTELTSLTTQTLLYSSLGELVETNQFNFDKLLFDAIPSAMRMCLQPQQDATAMSVRTHGIIEALRVETHSTLFELIAKSTRSVVVTGVSTIDGFGFHPHVSRALISAAGTLRERLASELVVLLASALAFSLRFYDTDFGLNLALSDKTEQLWHSLAAHTACVVRPPTAGIEVKSQLVPNSSLHPSSKGFFEAAFPFSFRLFPVLEGAFETGSDVSITALRSVCTSVFGPALVEQFDVAGGEAYLKDYVATHGSHLPALTVETRFWCYAMMVSMFCNSAPLAAMSPILVHYVVQTQHDIIEAALALISMHLSKKRDTLVQYVLAAVESRIHSKVEAEEFAPFKDSLVGLPQISSPEAFAKNNWHMFERQWLRAWVDGIWCQFGSTSGGSLCEESPESWFLMAQIVMDSADALGSCLVNVTTYVAPPDNSSSGADAEAMGADAEAIERANVVIAGTLTQAADKSLREDRCLWGGSDDGGLCRDWCSLRAVAALGLSVNIAPEWRGVKMGETGLQVLAACARACQPPFSSQSLVELSAAAMRLERLENSRKDSEKASKDIKRRLADQEAQTEHLRRELNKAKHGQKPKQITENHTGRDKDKSNRDQCRAAIAQAERLEKSHKRDLEQFTRKLENVRHRQLQAGCAADVIEYFVLEIVLSPLYKTAGVESLWPCLAQLASGTMTAMYKSLAPLATSVPLRRMLLDISLQQLKGELLDDVLETVLSTESGKQLYLEHFQDLLAEAVPNLVDDQDELSVILQKQWHVPDRSKGGPVLVLQDITSMETESNTSAVCTALAARAAVMHSLERFAAALVSDPQAASAMLSESSSKILLCHLCSTALQEFGAAAEGAPSGMSAFQSFLLRAVLYHGGFSALGSLLREFSETKRPSVLAWLPSLQKEYLSYEVPDLFTMLVSCLPQKRVFNKTEEGAAAEGAAAEAAQSNQDANKTVMKQWQEAPIKEWQDKYNEMVECVITVSSVNMRNPSDKLSETSGWFTHKTASATLSAFAACVLGTQHTSKFWVVSATNCVSAPVKSQVVKDSNSKASKGQVAKLLHTNLSENWETTRNASIGNLISWVCGGCPVTAAISLEAVQFAVGATCLASIGSPMLGEILRLACWAPDELGEVFLPGMERGGLPQLGDMATRLGWYKCPNGQLLSHFMLCLTDA